MNIRLILRMLGAISLIEAAAMLPSAIISLIYGDGDFLPLLMSALIAAAVGLLMRTVSKPKDTGMRAREGFVSVALAWILLSVLGALPFVFSGFLPHFVDALFEAISGFTTTGATVVTNFDHMPHGVAFWRSFTHWIGGMGVLVLTLAFLPKITGNTSHLVRAESPGPTLSKIMPKMGDTAKMLYLIYLVLTIIEFIILMIAGMNPYDAAIHAMGTAGTGGFSNYGASVGAFNSTVIEVIITIFMVLFGINFALFYQLITGHWKEVVRNEELRWYLSIFIVAFALMTLFILPYYGSLGSALRYAGFQVASLMSTTGYATADFAQWPSSAQMLVFVLLFVGSCAGSTAGGIKTVRIALAVKQGRREIRHAFQQRKVQRVRFEGRGVEEQMLHQVMIYIFVYVFLALLGGFLISLENKYDVLTNFTASLTCISNVGPGLAGVGPAENFAGYGIFAKLVMSLLMLAGRLELYPLLVLFHPAAWRRS